LESCSLKQPIKKGEKKMTLYNVLAIAPGCDVVTVEDYLSGEIYVDRKEVYNVIEKNDQQWHRYLGIGLKNFRVYSIEVGKVYSDLIVKVLKDE
jgi:hypothetical protein